jgi:alanine racemase
MKQYKRVYASINLDAVTYNMEAMKKNLPAGTKIIGVVKADGYGHGSVPVACAIDPYVAGYAVATAEEGMILRRHGITKPILVLGAAPKSSYSDLIDFNIRPAMFTRSQLETFNAIALEKGKKAPVHLAVDTGMSRIGMKPDETSADMVKEMGNLPGIELEGMFTHFARADEKDGSKARKQMEQYLAFEALLEQRGIKIPVRHCANSAGIIESIGTDLDMVRAGISIYGMYPSDEVETSQVLLKPVMELKSFLTYIKTIEPGTEVSYGGTFTAKERMRIGTVPVGYGDGYPRNLSGKGWVLIKGKKANVLGRVCMDQFMVDVTGIDGAEEGEMVTLIGRDGGEQILVEDLAKAGGGFHYEIVCDIGKRVPRVYYRNQEVIGTKDYFDDSYEGVVKSFKAN